MSKKPVSTLTEEELKRIREWASSSYDDDEEEDDDV